jgi:hypothetical protein
MRRPTVVSLPLEIEFPAFYLKTVSLSDIIISFPILDFMASSWVNQGKKKEGGIRRSIVLSLPLEIEFPALYLKTVPVRHFL